MIYNETFECMTRENLKDVQSERLKKITEYVFKQSPFYQKKMVDLGVTPSDIKGIDDIGKLPLTVKDDLRDHYPFGIFSKPIQDIRELHVSSGTTGNPTVVGYTK
jgi:phenylacetate-CoA ligase